MKETLSTSIETINKIRTQALDEINNTTLQTVLQDTASIQILTINVATETGYNRIYELSSIVICICGLTQKF